MEAHYVAWMALSISCNSTQHNSVSGRSLRSATYALYVRANTAPKRTTTHPRLAQTHQRRAKTLQDAPREPNVDQLRPQDVAKTDTARGVGR